MAGNDILYGGGGNDILAGGAGDDTYIYYYTTAITHGQDTITDGGGENTINLVFDSTTLISSSDWTDSVTIAEDSGRVLLQFDGVGGAHYISLLKSDVDALRYKLSFFDENDLQNIVIPVSAADLKELK